MPRTAPSTQFRLRSLLPAWLADPWGMVGLASILYVLAFISWAHFHWGGEEKTSLITGLATLPPIFLQVLLAWRVALQKEFNLQLRQAWFLLGLGTLISFLGDATWIYVENVLQLNPFPSAADIFYVGSCILTLWGLLKMPGARLNRHDRLTFWFNLLIMMTTASMFIGYYVIVPIMSINNASPLAKLLATAYPVFSLMIFSGLLSILLRLPETGNRSVLILLLAGVSFSLVSDLAFAYTSLTGVYASGNWMDSGWYIAQAFMVLAALRQMYPAPSTRTRGIVPLNTLVMRLPLLAGLLGFGLVAAVILTDFNESTEWLFVAVALLSVLIIAQQIYVAGFSDTSIRTKLILTFLLVCVSSLELEVIFSYLTLHAHPDSIMQVIFVNTLLVSILATGAAIFLGQRFVAPLSRLTAVARQLSAGDFSAKAQIESQDEIGILANTFNTMLESLARTQDELRKAEFFTRSIFSSLSAHVAVIDRQGQILTINKAWEDFARANGDPYLQSTGIGVNYLGVLRKSATDPEIALLLENLQEVLDGKRHELSIEYPCHSATKKHWFLMNVMPMHGAEQGAVISHTDVTELKLAQQALLESEERYRRLVDYSPDMIAVHDKNKFVFINPAGAKLLGASSTDEIVGQPLLQIIPPQYRETAKQEMDKSLASRVPTPLLQQTVQRIDGTTFEAEFSAMPILYAGKPAIQIVMREITERRRLEEQWQKFKQGIERSSDAMFMTDVGGTIHYINPAFEKLYGYSEGEAVGNTPRILKSGLTSGEVYQHYWEMLLAGQAISVQHTNRAKDGRFIDIEGSHNPILDECGSLIGFLAVHRDVTERKRAQEKIHQLLTQAARHRDELETRVEQRTVELSSLNGRLQNELQERQRLVQSLRESEAQFRLLFEASPDAVVLVDPNHPTISWPIVDCNEAACAMNGYAREELIGQSIDVLNGREPASTAREEYAELIRQKGIHHYEGIHRHKSGHFFPVEVSTSMITIAGRELILSIDRDITERKQAELAMKEAKETAEESRRAAEEASRAKSEFLSRMSHELRTPMNAILGFAQLMEMSRKEPLSFTQKERVHQIVKGGQHLLELINEILDISRIEANRLQVSPEPVSVRESIQEVVDLTLPLAVKHHIQIVTKLGGMDNNPFVMADRQRFKQVLLNILGNAVKYNYDDGTVIITCDQTTSQQWRISIADSGPGIPKEQQGRLFKPFERLVTDQSGIEGTGLGLALAKRLIELMRGRIGVESMVGKGSTFWIELPRAESPTERLQRLSVTGELPVISPTARTIVYVEDNVANFELIKQVLADYSQIELLWAPDFKSGIETARQRSPDLILLDVHLGGEDGAEVLQQLQQQRETAETPVIIVSADATSRQAERLLSLGAYAYLTKPLDVKSFIRLVEELLREKEA